MSSHHIINIGDSESEFSGSIAWMEIPDNISSGSSVFGEQEFVDETFLVPKAKSKSNKKKSSTNVKSHGGITFEKAVSKRYNLKNPIVDNEIWKKKIFEFKQSQNLVSNTTSTNKCSSSSISKKSTHVVSLEKNLGSQKINSVEFSRKQQKFMYDNDRFYFDGKFRIPLEYLPVISLERIQVPGKKVVAPTALTKSSRKSRSNPSEEDSVTSEKSSSATSKKMYQCEECDYKSNQQSRLKCHMVKHDSNFSFQCPKCSVKSKHWSTLKNHITVVHNNEFPYKCPHCSNGFINLSQINNNHSCFFAAGKVIECEICKKRLAHQKSLNSHKNSFHSFKLFTCALCQEVLRDKFSFETHKNTHKNGGVYVCNKCKYKTIRQSLFKRHCNVHR